MTKAEILTVLTDEITVLMRTPADAIRPDAALADLGINSLTFIELLLAVERRLGLALADRGVTSADVKSLDALADRVEKELMKN